jgi:hypothetical protein
LRAALIIGLAAVAVGVLFLLPPIPQDLRYHEFAGQRTVWGVPNFWNVVSNLAFLLVALWGLGALRSPAAFVERWERAAYCILLAGLALVAAGSTYYHLQPDHGTLFWDRLPMTVVFMSLLAITIGERISAHAGRLLLLPLVALGVASVVYLFPPRYTGAAGLVAMMGLYGLAKIAEGFDQQLAAISPAGGHPWKHVAAAAAMLCYVNMVARRRPARL